MRLIIQLVGLALLAVLGVLGWIWFGQQGPVDNGNGEAQGTQAPVRVEVAAARTGTVRDIVQAVGTTRGLESVDIVAEVSGRITEIGFREGQQVSEGHVLFRLDRVREESELREAIAQRDDLRQKLERARKLLEDEAVSRAEVDELASELEGAEARVAVVRSRLIDREIRAPFDGTTGLREVSLGAFVEPGTLLTTLDDLSVVRVDFSVPERFLGALSEGLKVSARNVAFDENSFEGEVSRIGTRVDPITRSVRVQSEFDNSDGRLRPGMFMTVQLVMGERPDAVLVPEEALQIQGAESYAFVVEDDTVRRTSVTLGQRRRGEVEILEGISAGDELVVAGVQRVRDGARVQILAGDDTDNETAARD